MREIPKHEKLCRFNDDNRAPCKECGVCVPGNLWKEHSCVFALKHQLDGFRKDFEKLKTHCSGFNNRFHTALRCVYALREQVNSLHSRSVLHEATITDLLKHSKRK